MRLARQAAIQEEKTQARVNPESRFDSGIGSLLPSNSSNLASYCCPFHVKRTVMCSSLLRHRDIRASRRYHPAQFRLARGTPQKTEPLF
jgi:hypothetical protein